MFDLVSVERDTNNRGSVADGLLKYKKNSDFFSSFKKSSFFFLGKPQKKLFFSGPATKRGSVQEYDGYMVAS